MPSKIFTRSFPNPESRAPSQGRQPPNHANRNIATVITAAVLALLLIFAVAIEDPALISLPSGSSSVTFDTTVSSISYSNSSTTVSTLTTSSTTTSAHVSTSSLPTTSSSNSSSSTSLANFEPADPDIENESADVTYPANYTELANFALNLINTDRTDNSLSNVSLSPIDSGQQHADALT